VGQINLHGSEPAARLSSLTCLGVSMANPLHKAARDGDLAVLGACLRV
jgi:hypothetical protein